jgi:hypothetical protein
MIILLFSDFCCEGHLNSSLEERLECIKYLDEFVDFVVSRIREA